MFSGIVEESAAVLELLRDTEPCTLRIESFLDHSETELGDSIAIDGVCLTVVAKRANSLSFELAPETLRRTTLASLRSGMKVNLERSLKVNARLHGHFVFGHVDAVIKLLSRERDGACDRLVFDLPDVLRGFLAPKGSVSLSGVSLTVGEVTNDSFSVYIIPHTSSLTSLGSVRPGSEVNIEVDMLARYVHALLQRGEEKGKEQTNISETFLEEHGYSKG